jgi:signal transduction histidine kinase
MTNAYKYTKENGFVKIIYEKENENLILSIEDSGEGIPETEIADIFKAYYRGKSSVKIPGEGIGLYVVKENISKIGGKVEVSSTKGIGSIFRITIPLKIIID